MDGHGWKACLLFLSLGLNVVLLIFIFVYDPTAGLVVRAS